MSKGSPIPLVALAAAIDLPDSAEAPEWVHLLPAVQGEIQTYDNRGPYKVADMAAVIAASMQSERGLPIDENHSTDLSSVVGGAAPARGWITELEARADGLWGKVRWTSAGRALMTDRAYRGISPVFNHTDDMTITQFLRASLTNKPNLKGLVSLNTETTMNMAAIAKALGLGDDATEEAIIAAIGKLKKSDTPPALQAEMTAIGAALGIEGGDPAAILAAAKSAKGGNDVVTALQAEVTTLTTSLNSLTSASKLTAATTFVDGEIKKGRQNVKPLREHYIAMHQEDSARVEKEIGMFAILGAGSHSFAQPPANADEITSLNTEQTAVADQLGIPHDKFLARLQADSKKGAN